MARPLSEKKREAILTAATELIASQGIGVSTAAVAKAAKVADGTLFTYFQTKDELLNQLYLTLSQDLADTLRSDFPANASPRDRLAHILEKLIHWGVSNPLRHQAKYRLRASHWISPETRQRSNALFGAFLQSVQESLAGRIDPALATFYIGSVLPGLADITIEAILARPEDRERLTRACFELFWKGVAI